MTEPIHLAGALLDLVYVSKSFLEGFDITCSVPSVYFSFDDSVRVEVAKKCMDFRRYLITN